MKIEIKSITSYQGNTCDSYKCYDDAVLNTKIQLLYELNKHNNFTGNDIVSKFKEIEEIVNAEIVLVKEGEQR